jgi:P-type conjugative transfer ATPase TrbB
MKTITVQHGNGIEFREDRLGQMLATALGPEVAHFMEDQMVVELMLNPDGQLWVERLGEGRVNTHLKITGDNAERVIFLVASSVQTVCNSGQPVLSAEFPGTGSRFHGVLPPVVSRPVFTIRKKAVMIRPLEEYITDGIMTEAQKEAVIAAVRSKRNILIVGGTGSGKTTFANAVLHEIAKTGDRVVLIEDTVELQCAAPDMVALRSSETVSMNDLLKTTMRLRPDRIVVGEVRGPEALALLKAWNTGHPGGCATVHANSARCGLTRLEQLVQEAIPNPQRELIAEAVNLVVYLERCPGKCGRKIRGIVSVAGFANDQYILQPIERLEGAVNEKQQSQVG